jgi:hypothetical protein
MIIRLCLQLRSPLYTAIVILALLFVLNHKLIYATPAEPTGSYRYFAATGHSISGRVKAFYERNGGEAIFGLPLTEVTSDGDLLVQHFERARFEIRPDRIELTLLGSILTAARPEPAFAWRAEAAAPDLQFFPESGHSLGGAFAWFWKTRGGLPIFGYPISEEFTEVSPHDRQPYLVQYFQRARFEYHPEGIGTPDEVWLGDLGRAYVQARQLAPEILAPAEPFTTLSTATTSFAPNTATAKNILLAARRLDGTVVEPGATASFLAILGEVTRDAGFVEGDAIVGGKLVREIGGGVCQVSSTLYRAAFLAGVELIERHPHSRQLEFFADAPGFEAAIYAPGMDLRWRNDTASDMLITAEADTTAGKLTIILWGRNDGRTTTTIGPLIRDVQPSDPSKWQYDPSLPNGAVRQLARARSGMMATMGRVVQSRDGRLLHQNFIITRYAPTGSVTLFGAGVTPPPGVAVVMGSARPENQASAFGRYERHPRRGIQP